VLNVTMSEMDTYHSQKGEDLKSIAVDHLDGEIAFYEQVRRIHTYLYDLITPPTLERVDPYAP